MTIFSCIFGPYPCFFHLFRLLRLPGGALPCSFCHGLLNSVSAQREHKVGLGRGDAVHRVDVPGVALDKRLARVQNVDITILEPV